MASGDVVLELTNAEESLFTSTRGQSEQMSIHHTLISATGTVDGRAASESVVFNFSVQPDTTVSPRAYRGHQTAFDANKKYKITVTEV